MKKQKEVEKGISYDTKTIITVICLVVLYPVGVVLMFVWMKWKWWVKLLVLLPVSLFIFLPILAAAILIAINPSAQIEKAKKVNDCNTVCAMKYDDSQSVDMCIKECVATTVGQEE